MADAPGHRAGLFQDKKLRGKVRLVFFSQPFPLKRKNRYGNKDGDE